MDERSGERPGVMADSAAPPLSLRLFGLFEVCVQGAPLRPLRSRRGQWLLALLVLHTGREVTRDWLAGTLWPDSPEPQGLATLRRTLTDLRRALGSEADRLRSPTPQTLRLELSRAEADVLAFDAAVSRGDVPSLRGAVALYRGPLLEGCVEEWVLPERQLREQAYLEALEALSAHASAHRDLEEAEQFLRRAVAVDPLRESAHRALMQLLAARGDASAVTMTYRNLCRALQRELQMEPEPETAALFQQLRAQADRPQASSCPSRDREIPGSGLPVVPAPHRSGAAFAHNLPAQVSRFIGREREIGEVKQFLAATRLVTLTGAGGCGKTRFALRVAADLVEAYPEGIRLVELAALADPALVPQAVAAALGVREEPARTLQQTLVDYLRTRSLLLVLDNCEHLLTACALLAGDLLRACPNLRLLATSREELGITGEQTYRVPSLTLPDRKQLPSLERLCEFEAVQLFVDRAGLSEPSFTLTAANALAVVQVCRRLDGIPLAIELAAARLKLLSVEQVAARLDDRFRLLTGGNRTALPRHQTLRAAIDWSYELLTEPERILLRRLSVFAGGFALAAVEAICTGESIDRDAVLDLLSRLVSKSLVIAEEHSGEARYRLLETVRQYARDRLLELDEAGAVRDRHLEFFVRLFEEGGAKLDPWEDAGLTSELARWSQLLPALEAELDNLRAALEWSEAADGGAEAVLRVAAAGHCFWQARDHWREGREWMEKAVACSRGAPATLRARALQSAAWMNHFLDHMATAYSYCEESLALYQEIEDRVGIAWSGVIQAALARKQGNLTAAQSYLEDSLALFREAGNRTGIIWALSELAWSVREQGDRGRARALWEEVVPLAHATGQEMAAMTAHRGLACLMLDQGDARAARRHIEEDLALGRSLGYRGAIAVALGLLGDVACLQSDFTTAHAAYEAMLAMGCELQEEWSILWPLIGLAMAHLQQGDASAARRRLEEVLRTRRRWENRRQIAACLDGFGDVACSEADFARGVRLFGAAEAQWTALRSERSSGVRPLHERYVAAARAPHERYVSAARAGLGEESFAAAWEAGRAMSLEEACDLALETSDVSPGQGE